MFPQTVLDSLPAGIIITDTDLIIRQINKWFYSNGHPVAAGAIGMRLGDAFPELEERGLLSIYRMVLDSAKPITLSSRLHRYFLRMPPQHDALPEMPQSTTIIPVLGANKMRGIVTLVLDATSSVLTEQELRHEIDKLNALHEVDRALATLDLKACLNIITERARHIFGAESAAILLTQGDQLALAAADGVEGNTNGLVVRNDEGITGWVARHRQSVLTNDVSSDPRYLAVDSRIQSEMATPLIIHDACIGVLNVESVRPHAFESRDLDLLEVFAARAASAIHNARLHAQEAEQRRLAETLRDIGLALTAELDPDGVLDLVLELTERVVPYDSANVLLLEGNRVRAHRQRGYEVYGMADEIAWFDFEIEQLVNLQTMAESRRPYVVPDVKAYADWVPTKASEHIGSWAGAPIVARNKLLGFLSLDKIERNFYTQEMANRLAAFAAQAGLTLENARLYAEQQRMATTDPLTGLANRRYFDKELEREVERGARFEHSTALVMIDVDDFKNYNDRYGHPAGDVVLQQVAQVIQSQMRTVDIPARYGGEEFAIILPEASLASALQAAQRLRQCIEQLQVSPPAKITVSVGVATHPHDAADIASLVRVTDDAMYRAKITGKNRVVVSNASNAPDRESSTQPDERQHPA